MTRCSRVCLRVTKPCLHGCPREVGASNIDVINKTRTCAACAGQHKDMIWRLGNPTMMPDTAAIAEAFEPAAYNGILAIMQLMSGRANASHHVVKVGNTSQYLLNKAFFNTHIMAAAMTPVGLGGVTSTHLTLEEAGHVEAFEGAPYKGELATMQLMLVRSDLSRFLLADVTFIPAIRKEALGRLDHSQQQKVIVRLSNT